MSCPKCDKENAVGMKFCSNCGASIAAIEVKQQQTASSNIAGQEMTEIPEAWKVKFSLLEKADGPKLSKARDLSFGERTKVVFNAWGFLLGPFYYLAKGMWKKAIVLFALCVAAIVVLSMLLKAMGISDAITYYIAPTIFALRANIDYYKKVVLGDNGWW